MTLSVNDVAGLVGKGFAYGGRGPDKFDCYGLVMELFRREGREVPDYDSPDQLDDIAALIGKEMKVWHRVEKAPGTCVVFALPRGLHCGYMLPGDRFIHAWEHTGGVTFERMSMWKNRVLGFYEYRPL